MEIIDNLDVKPQTKQGYTYLFKILEKEHYNWKDTEKETEQFLNKFPIRKQIDLLNVIIVIRTQLNQPTKDYKLLRSKLQKILQVSIHEKLDNLQIMKSESFISILNQLYKNKKWIEYILNYLCYHYGVRNEDLRLSIDEITNGNYLIEGDKGIDYIRQNYKTVETYGIKHHVIKDKKFIESFMNLNTGLITDGAMSNYLKKKLILPEGQIFKMRIKELEEKGDISSIKQLAENRGTSLATVLTNYNINNKKYVIK